MKNITIDLEMFLENFPGNNYFKNTNGVYLGCNNNMAQLAKLDSPKDIIGKTDYDLWPERAEELRTHDQLVIQSGKFMDFEESINLKNLDRRYFKVIKTPLLNSDNKIVGVIGNSIEITDIKKQQLLLESAKEFAEKESKAIARQLHEIVESLPGAIYWKNKESIYLGVNDFVVKAAGRSSKEEIIGKTDYDIWPEEAEELRENDQRVMRAGKPVKIEEEPVTSCNGEKRFFTVVKMPLRDSDNNIVGIVGNSIDITDRKKMEEELKKANKAAEAANRAKTEFLANMTHDVKTPLASIVGLSKLLTRNLTDENLKFAQNLLGTSQELLKFFNSCIELSKLEYYGISTHTEIFNLKSLLNEIFNLFQPTAKEKNIDLNIHFDERIPISLLGNRTNVYRILLNLVGNAVKFTQEGSITIRAELSEKSTDQQAIVKLIITDTGIGIPPHKQEKIFERFTRLSSSHEGHGIGLYVVKKFVEAMGGDIDVSSQEGEGSEFIVVLAFERSGEIAPAFVEMIGEAER